MDKYICQCCGGKINRETMTCEYCGTQYKKENNHVLRIEQYTAPVREFAARTAIPTGISKDPKEIMEIAIRHNASELSKIIAPYCEYSVEYDPQMMTHNVRSRIRLIKPINSITEGTI